jgi:hypothetical protein
MILYRIEHPKTEKGMWHTKRSRIHHTPLVTLLTNQEIAKLPMPDSDEYRHGGLEWFSAVPTVEMLNEWFTVNDMRELVDLGFKIYEFEAHVCRTLEMEIIFTKKSVEWWNELTVQDITGE